MKQFHSTTIRHNIAAGLCAIALSVTTLIAVASPMAMAQNAVRTAQITVPLA